jgi:hypothetical protein
MIGAVLRIKGRGCLEDREEDIIRYGIGVV